MCRFLCTLTSAQSSGRCCSWWSGLLGLPNMSHVGHLGGVTIGWILVHRMQRRWVVPRWGTSATAGRRGARSGRRFPAWPRAERNRAGPFGILIDMRAHSRSRSAPPAVLSLLSACAAGNEAGAFDSAADAARHDVIWNEPGGGPGDSMPLGNGDLPFYAGKSDGWGNSRAHPSRSQQGMVRVGFVRKPGDTGRSSAKGRAP